MKLKIALAGNPNSGKTTLFNALTASNQFVGNWPGVTVEKKEGKLRGYEGVTVTDLPGIYSLSPYTPEEIVARNYLIREKPDVILNIVDGTNLERNLYLTEQLMELGIPVVIAINMMDAVKKRGDKIDTAKLSSKQGCAVITLCALNGSGVSEAAAAAITAAENKKAPQYERFSEPIEQAVASIEGKLHDRDASLRRWYAVKLFERDEKSDLEDIEAEIKAVEVLLDDDSQSIITNERYAYIAKLLKGCYTKRAAGAITVSDKIDRVVTNRFAALPIFAAVMFLVYYINVSSVGTWATDWANDGVFGEGWEFFGIAIPSIPALLEEFLNAINCAPWLESLIIDGIVGGVGAVLGFVPQMLILFIFLAFLESCGYMARIAFVLDRVFRKVGLSGKSFIPMLIGTGCGVPGIMASRTIENERDRRITIMTTTFIPCGAKLPIIALIATALFNDAWWVAPSAYFIGVAAIIVSGIMLKKTKPFYGEAAPFVMELPAYHMPTVGNILRSMWERASSFIKKAGTIILLSSIFIWAASRFGFTEAGFGFGLDMELEESVLGIAAGALCTVFAPLGFGTIKATLATFMGLVAKEEVVGVFGVLDFEGMSALCAYSFLVFNLLCAPCFAAIGAIRREMNSAKWTLFAVGYQCAFAYAVSLIIYQIGSALDGSGNTIGLIAALLVATFMLFMLLRPDGKKKGESFS